ncbi:plastidal glycolate/glycerate translocator 1, chloroplastic [Senna tora]|uniref:Plastidal glycolate/glycerate translocator 1, chloroplastic n=1 Tax=Senna tora TaxID=362788 RepID=A0A834U064_9FABA|nr:plastidal glycolate/glycerate translocator 1, chloroplastic [Senna tora]
MGRGVREILITIVVVSGTAIADTNTLHQSDSLNSTQRLVSTNNDFILGFFKPSEFTGVTYLAIWHNWVTVEHGAQCPIWISVEENDLLLVESLVLYNSRLASVYAITWIPLSQKSQAAILGIRQKQEFTVANILLSNFLQTLFLMLLLFFFLTNIMGFPLLSILPLVVQFLIPNSFLSSNPWHLVSVKWAFRKVTSFYSYFLTPFSIPLFSWGFISWRHCYAIESTSSISEIRKQISDAGVSLAFSVQEKARKLESLSIPIIQVPENLKDMKNVGFSVFYNLCYGNLDLFPRPVIKQEDAAAIMYSSGTTGASKGVVLTHKNFISMIELFVRFEASQYEYSSSKNVFLAVLPMFHIYGLSLFATGLLSLGSTVIVMRKFDVNEAIKVIDKYKITHVPAVPPMLTALIKMVKGINGSCLQSLIQVSCGAATLSRKTIEDFVHTLPNVDFIQGYGLTESTAVGTRGFNTEKCRNYSSIGLLAPNMEAKVVDWNTGAFLPPGSSGELWLRGSSIMRGYLNNNEATMSSIDKDGWLRTGDVVCFDEDGYLHISDRLKDMIKYKGYQVEETSAGSLLRSTNDEETGEIPVAFVVRKVGSVLSQEAILDYVAQQVAPYKKVRKVVFIENLPRFLQVGTQENHRSREISAKSTEAGSGNTSTLGQSVFGLLHLIVSLGLILAMDKFLKKAFVAAAIKFPSALFGMFCIFSVLIILDTIVPSAATALMNFFEPALLFIQRWLPLFYVPSLVVLPVSVKDIPAASGIKIGLIIVGGWLATLCVAGFTAIAVRKAVKTEMVEAEPMKKPSPFSPLEVWACTGVLLGSFVAALYYPTALGTTVRTCLPFLLASTVLGYMVGSGLPSDVKKVFHPIICCALSADLAAFAFGYVSKLGFEPILGYYLTKASSNPGAGDILMGFLGSVILSFAFSMFKQRKLVKRHAAEIFTSVIVSTVFSLYSTALVGRLVGLDQSLTVSILPRCITVALALSIVSLFEGTNSSLTAAVVVVTGLVGANFVQATLDKFRFGDPIARGIATASSAHGLGTAALSAKEPEALPFCAIAYALNGIFGSILCSIPAVRQSLLAVVG